MHEIILPCNKMLNNCNYILQEKNEKVNIKEKKNGPMATNSS